MIDHRALPLASSINRTDTHAPTVHSPALFLPQLTDTRTSVEIQLGTHIFLPSTYLDRRLSHSQRKGEPIFWEVHVELDIQSSHRIVRGTGQVFHGLCRPAEGLEPELFAFA